MTFIFKCIIFTITNKYKKKFKMSKVNINDSKKLFDILFKLEKISNDKNPIIKDMKWLAEKLQEAYKVIENS